MTVGINVDPNNPSGNPPARRLLAARLQGVRLTARDNPENRQYIADMLAAGVQVLAIVATEWFHPAGQGLIWPFQDTLNNAESGVCTVWNSFSPGRSAWRPILEVSLTKTSSACR